MTRRTSARLAALALFCAAVLDPAAASAQDTNAALDNLPPNRWVEVHRAPDRAGWLQRHAGAVYDGRRGTVLVFGSDTHDRPVENTDNAVHEFDPVALTWRTHDAPAPVASYRADGAGNRVAGTATRMPWAMHVMDAIVYDPARDALLILASTNHSPMRARRPEATNDVMWRYDLAARSWRFEDSTGGPPPHFLSAAAHDSDRDTIVVYGRGVWELGPDRRRWTKVDGERHHRWGFAMAYDSRNRRLAVFGDRPRPTRRVWVYAPGATPGAPGGWPAKDPAGEGCPASGQFPVTFDRREGVFLLVPHDVAAGASVTCIYDLAGDRYRRLKGAELPLLGHDENMAAMNHTMVYDSRHGVHLLITGYRETATRVLALRLDLDRLAR